MHTYHTPFSLASYRLHRIDFEPTTLSEADLLWLPHHHQLQNAVTKRKAEHLAGRIAAVYALREYGYQTVPGTGNRGQPLWPGGLYGSISHCKNTALAVVSHQPIGIDIETILTPAVSMDIADGFTDSAERAILHASGLPFPVALTLAFCAKESVFKAFSASLPSLSDFTRPRIHHIDDHSVRLGICPDATEPYGKTCQVRWLRDEQSIIALAF